MLTQLRCDLCCLLAQPPVELGLSNADVVVAEPCQAVFPLGAAQNILCVQGHHTIQCLQSGALFEIQQCGLGAAFHD